MSEPINRTIPIWVTISGLIGSIGIRIGIYDDCLRGEINLATNDDFLEEDDE